LLFVDVLNGIVLLQQTSERLGSELPLTFGAAPEAAVSETADVLALSSELRRAYEHGAPAGCFPSFVQRCVLDRVDQLAARQIGYAVSASGEVFPDWHPGWIVIGADDGEPFIAHADLPDTPVSVAIHGTGTWTPLPVAASLGTFYALVAAWSSLIVEDFDGAMLDEDHNFEVKHGFWEAFDLKLATVLAGSEITALRRYLSA
jgi:hypothetical protein